MDREKVIGSLQEAAAYFRSSFDAMYGTVACEEFRKWTDAIEQTLALLKAQEPRVMTAGEAKSAYVVEYRSGKMREIGSALLDLNVDPLNAEYGKIYRVWTSRPTEAEREAVKWDAQEQRDYEAAVEMAEYCERYEPTYNADDGSM